eukprot:s562_g37.t1
MPATQPANDVLGNVEPDKHDYGGEPQTITISLRIATCNVLSLCGQHDDDVCGVGGPARQELLLKQLDDEKICIFGFQETRLRRLHQAHTEEYFLFKSQATDRGHYGIIAGFSKRHPYAMQNDTGSHNPAALHFREQDFAVIHSQPRALIIRISAAALKTIVIVGHAPHSGSDPSEIENWWHQLHSAVPHNYAHWPRLLIVDANATVGHTIDECIGGHQPGPADGKSEAFEAFVRHSDIWLPATFEATQEGPGETWQHTGGRARRIDYIGLPRSWSPLTCKAWINENIDLSISRTDHLAACVDFSFVGEIYHKKKPSGRKKLTFDNAKQLDLEQLADAPDIAFSVDVHTHAASLQDTLVQVLSPQCQRNARKPRKRSMSEATWEIVQQKRAARSHLAELQRQQRRDKLAIFFDAWRNRHCLAPEFVQDFDNLITMQDKLIARALADFRHLGRAVSGALRRDDVHFFQTMLAEGSNFLEPQDVRKFWAVIRRALPKFRQRRAHLAPARLECLEPQMLPHLCDLEKGELIDPAELVAQCHQRQFRTMQTLADSVIPADTLPSLTQFETALRSTIPNKATGLDPIPSCVLHDQAPTLAKFYYDLILKMHLWCVEPVQYKGGVMCLIPKRGNLQDARNYRGILLLASVAKRVHSMMRTSLMTTLSPKRAEGQLGGFKNQMVQFGFHSVATWTRILEKKGLSTAVLYLIASAFHHLIREHVLGIANEQDFDSLIRDLQESGHPVNAREQGQRIIGMLETLGCDARLLALLRDVHTDTWFTISSQEIVRTRRGTRPGSPLADAVFHAIMTQIIADTRAWIALQTDFVELLQRHDVPLLSIVWADDVAVPWATAQATQLIPAIQRLMGYIDDRFAAHGFTINYELNKTNCVVSFQGKDAPALRREFLLHDRPGCTCELSPGREIWLHMRPTYKHLGYTFAASHSIDAELRQRVGQASQTLTTLSRAIFRNRHYPRTLRLRLFNALIATKLFYGLGTWRTPSLRQMRYLRTAYVKMLAKVLCLPRDHRHTNAQIFQLAGTMDVRVLLAFDRLRYGQKMFAVGPDFLHHMVHIEYATLDDSWMHGLATDLRWLNSVLPQCVPFDVSDDFTEIIDMWQSPRTSWKSLLKKAWRQCMAQEHMMIDVQQLHQQFFDVLRTAGAEFDPDFLQEHETRRDEVFQCPCGRQFDTPQGLALHRVRAHQQYAPEHQFISGASCPSCLRFFWSSARLQQHLAYIPRQGGINRCYQALVDAGYTTEYQAELIPRALQGTLRLDALQTYGPSTPLASCRHQEIQALHQAIAHLEEEQQVHVYPEDHLRAGEDLAQRLTQCTQIWIDRFRGGREIPQGGPDLADWWLRLLLAYEAQFDEWTELVFVSWGEHILPDILAEALDGEIEFAIDQIYLDLLHTLPRTEGQVRLQRMRQRLRYLNEEEGQAPQPHRPPKFGTANANERRTTTQKIPTLFDAQEDWLQRIRSMRWRTLPADRPTPIFATLQDQPHFLVVHLFSGRRRHQDVHAFLNEWAERRNVKVTVLSLDTANSPTYGNLAYKTANWSELLRCYDLGLVTATLAGSPCETFSEARHQPVISDETNIRRTMPRPLRSFLRLMGLPGLRLREIAQLQAGSSFFMQVTLLLAYQLTRGGMFVSEHPAPPSCPERASIWTSPWIKLLLMHPDVHLTVAPQWPFEATVPKPTGLLHLRLPSFARSLYKMADRTLTKPTSVAIGCNPDGTFRTSKHKEYPALFSAGLARSITDQLDSDLRNRTLRPLGPTSCPDSLHRWIAEAREACEVIRQDAVWLPDYQPVHVT